MDPFDLVRDLVEGGHSAIAGRLAGALRAVGREQVADDILSTMRAVGYAVTENNPFDAPLPELRLGEAKSPYVLRMRAALPVPPSAQVKSGTLAPSP